MLESPCALRLTMFSFPCLLSEHGWTGHQRRRHRSCHWRKRRWLVDSWKERAARLCARFLSRKDLMKSSPNPQTENILLLKTKSIHGCCSWPRATHNIVLYITSQEITNWPCFLLFSYPDPLYPGTFWPTLSAKTGSTSVRWGLGFLTEVLPTICTLCCHQCYKSW